MWVYYILTVSIGTAQTVINAIPNLSRLREIPVCFASLAICQRGDVRLVGRTSHSGRVEICFSETWGTVCSNRLSTADANVVCRQVGFSRHSEFIAYMYHFVVSQYSH